MSQGRLFKLNEWLLFFWLGNWLLQLFCESTASALFKLEHHLSLCLKLIFAIELFHSRRSELVKILGQLRNLLQFRLCHREVLRVFILSVIFFRVQLLEKEHFRVEVIVDAALDNARPIIRNELQLFVVVLYPFCLRSYHLFHFLVFSS